ncbi:MAG: energy transducer TonB [Lysobacteraceae bacterium]
MNDPTPAARSDAITRLSHRIRAALKPGNHWFPLALFTAALAVGLLVTVLVLTLRPHKDRFFNAQTLPATAEGAVLPAPEINGVSALPPPGTPTPSGDETRIEPTTPTTTFPTDSPTADLPVDESAMVMPQHAGAAPFGNTPVRILQRTQPIYPRDALRNGEQGVVNLLIVVGADGIVDDVRVVGRSGSRSLDRAAVDAIRDWDFQPATQGGMPVPATLELPIEFTLNGY